MLESEVEPANGQASSGPGQPNVWIGSPSCGERKTRPDFSRRDQHAAGHGEPAGRAVQQGPGHAAPPWLVGAAEQHPRIHTGQQVSPVVTARAAQSARLGQRGPRRVQFRTQCVDHRVQLVTGHGRPVQRRVCDGLDQVQCLLAPVAGRLCRDPGQEAQRGRCGRAESFRFGTYGRVPVVVVVVLQDAIDPVSAPVLRGQRP